MTFEQWIVTITLLVTFAGFILDKIRYDVIGLIALLVLVIAGIIAPDDAFQGFGHSAVITVAVMLALSHAIEASGIVNVITRRLLPSKLGAMQACFVLTGLVGLFSGFMNNVGALALFMPITMRIAAKNGLSPSTLLMPLAFGSILGGLTTMIGTPPNILIAEFRKDALGEPFALFDYTAVGAMVLVSCAVVAAALATRLVPQRVKSDAPTSALDQISPYVMELEVSESSKVCGAFIDEIQNLCESDINMLGALRDGLPVDIDKLGPLAPGTIIRVLATTDVLKELIDECGFHIAAEKSFGRDPDLGFATQTKETIVMKESESVGKTIGELNANKKYGLTLLGISRTNSKINEYLPDVTLKAGDILLVHSPESDDTQALADLGWIPLEDRPLQVTYKHSFLPTIFFLSAIGISAIGLIPVHIALVAALAATAVLERITLRDLYSTIDWPIIVLLGTMIPVGRALESTGLTQEIAELLTTVLTDLPVYGVIALIIAVAMTLSNVVNNSATAILIAPIALDLSKNLDVNPDSLLMAAAVGASCCFLTPIGHQSNLIVMNSGGYKFGDYWKLGLPVTLAALVVGTGSILIFWPT